MKKMNRFFISLAFIFGNSLFVEQAINLNEIEIKNTSSQDDEEYEGSFNVTGSANVIEAK